MTESNNVVEFPKHKIVRDNSIDAEAVAKKKQKGLEAFADNLTQEITENMLMDFDNSGINIESDTFTKDFHFLVGILTATIYRTMDLKHDLQDFIDDRVRIVKDEEYDILKSVDTIEFDKLEELDKPT